VLDGRIELAAQAAIHQEGLDDIEGPARAAQDPHHPGGGTPPPAPAIHGQHH
jgi:hypothetical protein